MVEAARPASAPAREEIGSGSDDYRPEMIYDGKTFQAPNGYAAARVNVFGRAAVVLVPDTAPANVVLEGGGGSCSCTSGTCTYGSRRIPPISYCEGSCSGTCTLTTGGGGNQQ